MVSGSVSFSYVLKVQWLFIIALICSSSAETPCAHSILRKTYKTRMRKRKGLKKIFPCLHLLYTILNALARHLLSWPILLGKSRSFAESCTCFSSSEQGDADHCPFPPSAPQLVHTLISTLRLQYYWRWNKCLMLAGIPFCVFSSEFPLHISMCA